MINNQFPINNGNATVITEKVALKTNLVIMSKKSEEFLEKMQKFFPSTRGEVSENIKEHGEILETVIIEDIFMPPILELLEKDKNKNLLKNIFEYFEEVAKCGDSHMINVLSVTALEVLGNEKSILETAKKYMGPKTMQLQIEADRSLGRL